jgi:transporter family protein
MWLLLAFLSAALLGFYDVFKKKSLRDNAVLPVLFLNTLFSSLIFLPFILVSAFAPSVLGGTMFDVPVVGWEVHKFIIVKSFIVLSSWIFGYFGMKHLPLTIVGPINATRPVMVLVGAMVVFGERLNLYQWIGVMLAIVSFFMLSRSGKKEGIDFKHKKCPSSSTMAVSPYITSGSSLSPASECTINCKVSSSCSSSPAFRKHT